MTNVAALLTANMTLQIAFGNDKMKKNKTMRNHSYLVYMTTNPRKSALYTGMTNNLLRRLVEHFQNRGKKGSFAGKYFCYNLVWFEWHQYVYNAIAREKEIKGFSRKKKQALIAEMNPEWRFLNTEVCGMWPPNQELLEALGKEGA